MTVINHKSISGITSITAPAGSDNLLTVHTNDTTERFRIVDSGAIVTGVTTASNFKTGTTNVHNVGVEAAGINVLGADTPIGTGATIYNSGAAVFTGVVTATEYRGGGSTGIKVTSTGKVGVGTASPDFIQHNYHATDNVLALFESGDEAALISFQDNNSTNNTQVWLGAQTNDLRLAAGGNERLRIKSDGKTGINTTSPTYGSHLHGTGASNNAYYMAEQSSAGASAGFRLKTTGSHFSIYGAVSGSALGIYDYNAGAERFTIDSSGYIKLSGRNVQGSANGDKLLRIYQPSRTDAEEDVLLLQSYNQSGTSSIIIGGGDSSFNAATDISFRTAAINTTSGSERLRITSTGQVRIDGPTAAAHGLRFTPNGWNSYDNRMGYCGSSGADFWWSSNWNPTDGARDHSGYATNFIRHNISTGYLSFGTGAVNASASERLRIALDGAVNIGASGDVYDIWNTLAVDQNVKLQVRTTVGEPAGIAILQERGDSNGANLIIGKSRGGSGKGAITSGDQLGWVKWAGGDGTRQHNAAGILGWSSGTVATGRVAGNLSFYTAPDSVSSVIERFCIDSAGRVTLNQCDRTANVKALRIKADNDTTSTASTDRTGSNSYKNSAIVIQKGISNGSLVAGLIDAWDTAIHATSIGITYTSGRYHTSIGVNNDTNDRPVEIMTISGNKKVKIGGGIANISADIGLEIGGDGATTEIRLKNSGGGTGQADGFAIQKWSNGNNYIYDYDSNHILFGTGNLSRTRMDTSGRWCFSPSSAITSGSNVFTMSLIHEGNFSGTGIYPGIAMKSTDTGGGDGMSIHAFDANWDLYSRSGNRDGISIANDAMTASSGYSRVCIGGDGAITMGKTVYDHLTTSRYCHTALHVAGGAVSIGGVGNSTQAHRGGVYTLGWYITQHSNSSYYHIKTDLWAGGSPHGNNEYIMGGFRIEGYSYSSPTGSSTAWVQFHNWSGSYPGLSVKQHYHNWDMGATVYTSSDGYVVLRVNGGTYKSHVIDIIQHVHYPSRNIGVASFAQNNSATHF